MYQKVSLTKYFDIKQAIQSDKITFDVSTIDDVDAVPFLGRSAVNNGIVDYVKPIENRINKGRTITIALDGSTGSTFYHHHDFSSGQNIWILEAKEEYFDELPPGVFLFLITTIRKAVNDYSWNLSLTKGRLSNIKILLPIKDDEKVDVELINELMKSLRNIEYLKNISEVRLY